MKYLTILKVIVHYVLAGLGKLVGYIVTLLVGIKCNRSIARTFIRENEDV